MSINDIKKEFPIFNNKIQNNDLVYLDSANSSQKPQVVVDRIYDFYTKEFERSGFRGPLNYYRNHNLTWELTAGAPQEIQQPAMFAAGDRDGVIALARDALEKMPSFVKDLRVNKLIPGIGHWTQQEAPDDVNRILLNFLASL